MTRRQLVAIARRALRSTELFSVVALRLETQVACDQPSSCLPPGEVQAVSPTTEYDQRSCSTAYFSIPKAVIPPLYHAKDDIWNRAYTACHLSKAFLIILTSAREYFVILGAQILYEVSPMAVTTPKPHITGTVVRFTRKCTFGRGGELCLPLYCGLRVVRESFKDISYRT